MNGNNRIGFKLGMIILSAFLIVLLSLGFALDRMFSKFYSAEMKTELQEMADHFSAMIDSADTSSEQMMLSFADFSSVSIYYTDAAEQVLFHSGGHNEADRSFIRSEDEKVISAGRAISFEHKDSAGNHYLLIGQPLPQGSSFGSVLYLMSSTKHRDESLMAVRKLLLFSGIGAFILAVGMTWIIARILSRPLLLMQKATKRIALGELETRLDIRRKDEIGFLAEAINDLAVDLQRYRDTRQEFLATISHELRTPITYLEGYAKVVKDKMYETEAEKDSYLEIIYQEAQRIQHLVDDLFELSKMEEGKTTLFLESLDLTEVVDQAVSKVALKAKDRGLSLNVYRWSAALPLIVGDGMRLQQVVLNLLDNAIRYTESGRIDVTLSHHANFVQVTVEDTGMGIPEAELPYIFERFYRVEKSRSRQFGGTGLGLAIAKKLVELQGGTIQVSSKLQVGTRIELQFPLEESLDLL
ncbi:MAG: HAMP domain-containing histidine kinase [Gorillibacterium sp.]|nr:HAMP domain-containing histidine kinase [Gorillibacterium sp.]